MPPWAYVDPAHPLLTGVTGVQDMLFTTPLDMPDGSRFDISSCVGALF